MKFFETEIEGVFLIEVEKITDERGFFARSWDKKILKKQGLNSKLTQCNISFNLKKGTLRGMHYQESPYQETKIVRCTRGSAFEVVIDLRKKSKTYLKWIGTKLGQNDHKMLYVPKGCALGFQTLQDNTEVFYQISENYMPNFAKGIRWDDKIFNISWPLVPTIISKKDLGFKLFKVD